MRSKTAIYFIFALTFSPLCVHANFTQDNWIYHGPAGDKIFPRCGNDLGNPLVSLGDICKEFSLRLSGKKDLKLRDPFSNREIQFSTRHKKVIAKNWSQTLSALPVWVIRNGKRELCVPLDFGDRALTPLLTDKRAENWDDHLQYVNYAQVIVDPGHGGNDWGAVGIFNGEPLKEKDLVLDYSREFLAELKTNGIESAPTRNRDDFVALDERYALVNKIKPKLFVSLHMNSNGPQAGFEIFTLSNFKRDRKSMLEVGKKVSGQTESALLTFKSSAKQEISLEWGTLFREVLAKYVSPVNAGMRREPFFLLYAVDTPGVLLELGYMDREEDMKFWLKPEKRKEVWKTLATGIAGKLKRQ